jgi:hypothetical protein
MQQSGSASVSESGSTPAPALLPGIFPRDKETPRAVESAADGHAGALLLLNKAGGCSGPEQERSGP